MNTTRPQTTFKFSGHTYQILTGTRRKGLYSATECVQLTHDSLRIGSMPAPQNVKEREPWIGEVLGPIVGYGLVQVEIHTNMGRIVYDQREALELGEVRAQRQAQRAGFQDPKALPDPYACPSIWTFSPNRNAGELFVEHDILEAGLGITKQPNRPLIEAPGAQYVNYKYRGLPGDPRGDETDVHTFTPPNLHDTTITMLWAPQDAGGYTAFFWEFLGGQGSKNRLLKKPYRSNHSAIPTGQERLCFMNWGTPGFNPTSELWMVINSVHIEPWSRSSRLIDHYRHLAEQIKNSCVES